MGSSTLVYHEMIEAEEAEEMARTTYEIVLTPAEQDRLSAMLSRIYLPAGFTVDKAYQSMMKKLAHPKIVKRD